MATNTDPAEAYHLWYYDNEIWQAVRFLGVPCYKSVSDMWNYQEILADLKPSLVVEFGTHVGGSALYFSAIGRLINPSMRVVSVDICHDKVYPQVRSDEAIQLITASSTDQQVYRHIARLRNELPGKVFFILDSDHSKAHVLMELELLRTVVQAGDYVIVEDGNINGNPVLPGWGEGPYEALLEYFRRYPDDYRNDIEREKKFGFTFAPSGFLAKN